MGLFGKEKPSFVPPSDTDLAGSGTDTDGKEYNKTFTPRERNRLGFVQAEAIKDKSPNLPPPTQRRGR